MPSGQRMLSAARGQREVGAGSSICTRFGSMITEAPDSTTSVTHLKAIQQPGVAAHRVAVQAEVEVVLHAARVEHRDAAGLEDVLALVRERRGLGRVVVAREHQHAAVLRGAGGVGVLEHVAAAVDARALAVPHAEDAVVVRAGNMLSCCVPQIDGRGEVFVDAGLELDVVRFEVRLRAPQRLVEAAERRAAVARDEAGGVEARAAGRARAAASCRRISACVPVRKTLPLLQVYLSSSEPGDGGVDRASIAVLGACSTFRPCASLALLWSQYGSGTERLGEIVDEHARLRRQVAPVRVDRRRSPRRCRSHSPGSSDTSEPSGRWRRTSQVDLSATPRPASAHSRSTSQLSQA